MTSITEFLFNKSEHKWSISKSLFSREGDRADYLLLQEREKSMDGTCSWMAIIVLLGVGVKSEKQGNFFINWKLLSYRLTQLPANPTPQYCRKFNGRSFLISIPFQTFCQTQVPCRCKFTCKVNSTPLFRWVSQYLILPSRISGILLRFSI